MTDDETAKPAAHGSYRSGFAFGVLSFLGMGVIGLTATILTSRIYGVGVIGEYALVAAPVLVLWVISTVKEQAALIREISVLAPRHPRVTELFAAVFTFSSGLTFVMTGLAMLGSWLVLPALGHADLVLPALVNFAGYAFDYKHQLEL